MLDKFVFKIDCSPSNARKGDEAVTLRLLSPLLDDRLFPQRAVRIDAETLERSEPYRNRVIDDVHYRSLFMFLSTQEELLNFIISACEEYGVQATLDNLHNHVQVEAVAFRGWFPGSAEGPQSFFEVRLVTNWDDEHNIWVEYKNGQFSLTAQ